jgi:dihydroorotase
VTPSVTLIRQVRLIDPACDFDQRVDLLISPEGVVLSPPKVSDDTRVIEGKGLVAMPGLIDMHVHFRQPGFEYKETVATGTQAALAGGVTTVVTMPNTKPTVDNAERVREQMRLAAEVDGVEIVPSAAVTLGLLGQEPCEYAELKKAGAIAITDDGRPVMSDALMRVALEACARHDLLFMQHAEDLTLSRGAPMNLGEFHERVGVPGQPGDAEGVMVERDIELVKQIGARYHVLHASTARSLNAVRAAKNAGFKVSCEVAPHHLLLTDEACVGGDTNKKMNPPLRAESDRCALIEAIVDGTVDAIASDHAPHSAEEKGCSFCDAPFGVVGLETAFAALLTFVHRDQISLTRAVELMTTGPARVLGISDRAGSVLALGAPANLCLVDVNQKWAVEPPALWGRSKNSAFLGMEFQGRVVATFLRGRLRYECR